MKSHQIIECEKEEKNYIALTFYEDTYRKSNKYRENEYDSHEKELNNFYQGSFFSPRRFFTQEDSSITHIEKESIKYKKAKALFEENLPQLLKKYKCKYVVVAEGDIMIGDNKEDLRKSVIKKYGRVSMYLKKIEDKQQVIKYKIRPKFKLQ